MDILRVSKKGLENESIGLDISISTEEAMLRDFVNYDIIVIDIRVPKINRSQFLRLLGKE